MAKQKPSVYIETTIVSYLTSKISRDLITAANQELTREWWDLVMPKVDCYISPFVTREISKGNPEYAKKRIDAVKEFKMLAEYPEIEALGEKYIKATGIPEDARTDAFHMAMASWYRIDYLLSWNCAHIVSAPVMKKLDELNLKLGMKSPMFCTPQQLMEV